MKRTLFFKTFALLVGLMFSATFSWGQALLVENFEYPLGSLLTASGNWTAHSGGGTAAIDVTAGLNFTGYLGSGIGGAANLDNNGEDDNRTFAPQTSGTVYAAFVIQTQSTNAAGYFIHFGQTVIGTTFFTRVWVNATGNGVGIGTSAPATYTPITAGVPWLLVIKYDITTKISSLFVFSTFPASEPVTPNATFTEGGGYANVGCIALRQYIAAERVIVDGIRVATTWADAVTPGSTTQTVAMPTFSPTPGVTENPVDVIISCTTPLASIHYTLDGSEPTQASDLYSIPIHIATTTTLKARAFLTGWDPSSIAAGNYTFRTAVSTIAELRAGAPGVPYLLSGEVFLTYQQAYRHQKFVQDYTGAMLIDDAAGIITYPDYEIGDGIVGLKGSFSIYQGMLEFVPAFNPSAPTNAHLFTPEVVTINDLNNNFENYESELVKLVNVTFADGGALFNAVTPTPYAISDVSDASGFFRTTFLDADYLGTTIPIGATTIIGICNQAGTTTIGNYITSRTSADIIPNVVTPTIIVTRPDGGEFWQQGTTEAITWNNLSFTGNVTIQLLSGLFSTPLATNIANTGTFNWVIPAGQTLGSNYKIRVKGINAGDPTDDSDATFSIVPNYGMPQVVINEIMYNPSNTNPPLSDTYYEYMELYNKGGFDVNLEGWTISSAFVHTFAPGATIPAGGYLVLAINADSVMNYYGITNVVKWTSGNLNNTGEAIVLKTSAAVLIDSVSYLSTAPWPTGANGSGPSLELIDPALDNTLPGNWLASTAIHGTPGAQNSVLGLQSLVVTSPNGGESYVQGSTHPITWISGNFTGTIKIELDNGAKALQVLAENVPVTDGTWSWAIPANQAAGTTYKIKISDQADGSPMDLSNAAFTITAIIPPSLTVVSPNGGEQWLQGSTQAITWTSTNFTGNITVALVATGTANTEILFPSVPAANGTVSWTITQAVRSDYKIKIYEMVTSSPMDESDATFSITAVPVESLTVTSPNGGEQWMQGATHPITWTSANFTGNIKIELETVAKGLVTLVENIPVATGTWSWAIPAAQALGANYKIRISDQVDGNPMDQSDAVFSIIAIPALPKIVITEIYYNGPESNTDTTEFIEIYNNDVMSVNLLGWYFSLGVVFTFPDYNLPPGGYMVTAFKSSAILNTFGVTSYQWTSGGLSNSGEPIVLKNASGTKIDSVSYSTGGLWPTAANGNGPSLSLCDPSSDNSLAANWSPCIEYVKNNAAGAGIYATPGAGCSGALAQTMIVPTGWSGISSYMIPTAPAIPTMFAHIVNSVVVVQDFSKIYLPTYGVNTIGNWDTQTGYQAKLTAAKYFVIKGTHETNKIVNLTLGWNGLPVISTCPVNVAALLGSHPEVIFVKDMGSGLVYWPAGGLSTLTTLMPGSAYFIKVSSPIDITFPECAAMDNVVPQKPESKISSIWNDVSNTGASHAIGFTASALSNLHAGDVIGAFTANGLCAGITEVGDGNALIMAWADDVYTLETDGFVDQETFTYKVYRPSTSEVFDVTAVYDNSAPDAGNFATNGISLVQELKMGATGIGTQTTGNIRIYPNPANSVVNVDLLQQFTNVEVYSMVGSLLYSGSVSGNLLKLDISKFDRGVYFLKLINQNSGDQTTTRFIKE